MTPLEHEQRWEQVWNLLMLDAVREVREELCIPENLEQLQLNLKEAFDEHYRTNDFSCAPGALNVRLADLVYSTFAETDALRLFAWGDYLSDVVHSRALEFFWVSTVYGINEAEHSDWVNQRFITMLEAWRDMSEQIDIAVTRIHFTDRDRTIRERLELDEQDLLTYFGMIARYNRFSRLWQQNLNDATPQHLDEVHAYGKALAQSRGLAEMQVSYPGSWMAGPRRSLLGG